eukprot:scaffold13134_cov69-Phaeocystis_antarctica.AAC.9
MHEIIVIQCPETPVADPAQYQCETWPALQPTAARQPAGRSQRPCLLHSTQCCMSLTLPPPNNLQPCRSGGLGTLPSYAGGDGGHGGKHGQGQGQGQGECGVVGHSYGGGFLAPTAGDGRDARLARVRLLPDQLARCQGHLRPHLLAAGGRRAQGDGAQPLLVREAAHARLPHLVGQLLRELRQHLRRRAADSVHEEVELAQPEQGRPERRQDRQRDGHGDAPPGHGLRDGHVRRAQGHLCAYGHLHARHHRDDVHHQRRGLHRVPPAC